MTSNHWVSPTELFELLYPAENTAWKAFTHLGTTVEDILLCPIMHGLSRGYALGKDNVGVVVFPYTWCETSATFQM